MKIPRITPEEVQARRARGEPITFVDSRNPVAWAESAVQLPGARRVPVDQVDQSLPERRFTGPIVVYCT